MKGQQDDPITLTSVLGNVMEQITSSAITQPIQGIRTSQQGLGRP